MRCKRRSRSWAQCPLAQEAGDGGGMWRPRRFFVALLLLALPLSAPVSSGNNADRTPLFAQFWDILPDGRTLASTLDTLTSAPNISRWVGAIINSPSDAGHCNAPELLCTVCEGSSTVSGEDSDVLGTHFCTWATR